MSFIDTNVLVQATISTAPDHVRARLALARIGAAGGAFISRQVVREYLSVVTRPQPWATPLPLTAAMQNARALEDRGKVWAGLQTLAAAHRFAGAQVHDANLVATKLAYGASRLLTFNARHFHRFAPLIEVIAP